MTPEMEKELQQLIDIRALSELKYTYCDACDDGHNPTRVSELFVEDGVWDGSEAYAGVFVGREEIYKGFEAVGPLHKLTQHNALAPRFTFTSDTTASAIWYAIAVFKEPVGDPFLAAIVYYEDYVKVDGKWYFKKIKTINRGPFMFPPQA